MFLHAGRRQRLVIGKVFRGHIRRISITGVVLARGALRTGGVGVPVFLDCLTFVEANHRVIDLTSGNVGTFGTSRHRTVSLTIPVRDRRWGRRQVRNGRRSGIGNVIVNGIVCLGWNSLLLTSYRLLTGL